MPRPRKELRLYKPPGRQYWYIVGRHPNGDRIQRSTGTRSREEASWCLKRFEQELKFSRDPTISELMDLRRDDLKARGCARAETAHHFHKPIKEKLGGLRPHEFTRRVNLDYIERRSGIKTKGRADLEELNAAFRLAKSEGIIAEVPKIVFPPKRPPKRGFLTRDEFRQLYEAAKAEHVRLFLLIAVTAGHRAGAICGLTWDRVDLASRVMDFQDPERDITKKRRTAVRIPEQLIPHLERAQARAATKYVVEYHGKPVRSVKRAIAHAARRAGLPRVGPHMLKHSLVSWLAEDGHQIDEIADLTATDRKTVWFYYRKLSPHGLDSVAASAGQNISFAAIEEKP